MEIHLGCSGWFYWHWKGIFYPEAIPTKQWFQHYTQAFDTVELNAPFYKWPRDSTVRNWKRDGRPGFRYTVKVNGEITHERRMVRTKLLVKKFYGIAAILEEQMGCFLFQFPPSYKYTPARLKSITAQLDPAYRNVVEFRHKSWWRAAVYNACAKNNITFCAVSSPRLPEVLPPPAERIYLRMHGRTQWYRHDYTTAELTTWARRLLASGAREAWIYFNNDREGYALKNAQELREIFREYL